MSSLKYEAERCLQCKNPSCSANCPVHTPVPEVINKLLEGKINEAGEILFRNNPLSAVTSIVCPHDRNCYGHCVLGSKGEPVEFYKIEQYISGYFLEAMVIPEIKKNGKKIAVIGAGPAGLTMAMIMAFNGYDVTIFEEASSIGGVLRYGIPGFRLQKDILGYYRKFLEVMDVKVRLNIKFGSVITGEDLFRDGYKAIFIAIGVGRPNKLGIPGELFGNVHYAIDYLKSPESYNLGKKVVIVGAGNVAVDAARTAIRKNHSAVILMNRGNEQEIAADQSELECALLEGARLMNNVQVEEILDDRVICSSTKEPQSADEGGTQEEAPSRFEVPCDSVILAIGQGPGAFLRYGDMDLTDVGLIKVDEFGETSEKNVWAAGDIVTGASTVVEAVAGTLRTAKYMLERLAQM